MVVVSNTSPLSNLAVLGRLDVLREQFNEILIPAAVAAELNQNPNLTAQVRLKEAFATAWLRVRSFTAPTPPVLLKDLHRGEAEAIALALELKAERILLDEADARLKAQQLGLVHTGVLGVLQKARLSGRIASLRVEINRLRVEAHFFVSPALEKELLMSVGEGE